MFCIIYLCFKFLFKVQFLMNVIDNNLDEFEVRCIKFNNINCECEMFVGVSFFLIFNDIYVNFSVDNFIE